MSIYKEFINDRFIFHMNSPLQFEYFLHRVFHKPPPIPPLVWNFIYREYARHGKWHRKVLNDLLEGIDDMNDPRLDEVVLNERIKDIKIPTLILWGDEDSFFPVAGAGFVNQQIQGSQLYIFEECGHGPHAEVPRKFAKHVKRFIQRLP
jgi:pimeloyl-ACP methyl ester carboxylesterase